MLLAGLATAGVATAIIIAILTIAEIFDWFRSRNAITEADAEVLRVTIAEQLATGKYRVVQGLFDKRNNSMVDHRVVEANELDDSLAELHRNNQVVVYE